MKFKKQLIETLNLNKKLLKSGLQINSSGLSKREWNELMEAFNLKDKLIK